MIVPKRLGEKSRIKVVLPASSLRVGTGMTRAFARGYDLLQKHFVLENSKFWKNDHQTFAASDEERAAELNEAFRSLKYDAIIAGRGGYGCIRILSLLDFKVIAERPKALIGFSDITIPQLAVYAKTGLASLSGPTVASLNDDNIQCLLRLLTADSAGLDLIPAANKKRIQVLQPGQAEGVLLGGNLSSLMQLIGTGMLPRLDNAIFVFEDISRTVDFIDASLHHLRLAGLLYKVTGVVIGDISFFSKSIYPSQAKWRKLLTQRMSSIFRKEIPVIMGVDYGHISKSITIPIGVKAELDTESRSLTLMESVTHA
ncbi:MAG: LD-carboxypeptidase [candidate division Zixibacteria bacterium]|nr:LD-carboxypeptidase [candidate division Zixibacteria bacterium]